ncbi:ATP-binding protein [Nonomuraea sp. H19]|uniref:ATP-binding protein n=1 Tax=Nonomuraea sp. H19 TaxID=3452206 RepID=UPI003F8AD90F
MEHGGGRGRLRMWREDGRVVCEVADIGRGISPGVLEEAELPAPSAPGGRGIWLIRRLSDEVVFTTGSGGTAVRLALELPPEPHGPAARADDGGGTDLAMTSGRPGISPPAKAGRAVRSRAE